MPPGAKHVSCLELRRGKVRWAVSASVSRRGAGASVSRGGSQESNQVSNASRGGKPMNVTVNAVDQNGVQKLEELLPPQDNARVQVTVQIPSGGTAHGFGMLHLDEVSLLKIHVWPVQQTEVSVAADISGQFALLTND